MKVCMQQSVAKLKTKVTVRAFSAVMVVIIIVA